MINIRILSKVNDILLLIVHNSQFKSLAHNPISIGTLAAENFYSSASSLEIIVARLQVYPGIPGAENPIISVRSHYFSDRVVYSVTLSVVALARSVSIQVYFYLAAFDVGQFVYFHVVQMQTFVVVGVGVG